MTIEDEIFKRTKIDFDKIVKYGFQKENTVYQYSKNIMNDTFRVDIEISKDGVVKGKIYDLDMEEEYNNFRVEDITGSFVSKVREEFKDILKDIRKNCFISIPFLFEQSNRIAEQIKMKYGDDPEFEWDKFKGYATFKNAISKKWYGLIMNLDKCKLDASSNLEVEIINVKLKPEEIEALQKKKGFYPAYHMNKKNWISIVLDDTINDSEIMKLIDESYSYTITKGSSNTEWIIPANPKYFDIIEALKKKNTITWKQHTNIKVNDLVYLYLAEPYSSILYKLRVKDVNLPYEYKDENIKMQKIMKLELIEEYEEGKLPLKKLKAFGVKAVRGPRSMPQELSKYIDKMI